LFARGSVRSARDGIGCDGNTGEVFFNHLLHFVHVDVADDVSTALFGA
jgi:hypothetical protein